MREYFLADHVHVGTSAGQAILLDLKRDRYLGFGRSESQVLAQWIYGWPCADACAVGEESATTSPQTDANSLLRQMITQQLITRCGTARAGILYSDVIPARSTLDLVSTPRIRRHVANCMLASVKAALQLRFSRLEKIVGAAAARKARHLNPEHSPDKNHLSELVSVFMSLRPWLFAARDACLFDSLALLEFLATYRIYPTWIFGVLAAPFAAHSWLQQRDVVLNDYPENVLKYTPILAI